MADYTLDTSSMYTDEKGVVSTEDGAAPEVQNGATFAEFNDPPATGTANKSVTVSGVAGFDCPSCIQPLEVRIVADMSSGETKKESVGELNGRGETAPFDISIPVPAAGESVTVEFKAQHYDPGLGGGWKTDNTRGPFTINAVSEREKQQEMALDYAPWAIGGGGAGYLVARQTGMSPLAAAGAGAAIGVGAKEASGGDIIPDADFPTTEVLALTALLGTGAILLRTSGASNVAQAATSYVPERR